MLIIKNADLVNMAGIYHEPADILIDGKIIKEIGTIDVAQYPEAEVIDAAGRCVTPGLVDAHCHIGLYEELTGPAGADGNEFFTPIMPELRGIDAVKPHDPCFAQAVRGGVTTVVTGPGSAAIIGGTFCALKTVGKTIYDMVIVEELSMKMALGENPKRVFGGDKKFPATRMGNAATLREALFKAKEYAEKIKKYEKQVAEGKEDATKPEFNIRWHSLMRVFEGFPVKIHAHQADDIVTAIKIMEEFGLVGSIEHCTEGYLIPEILREKGIKVIIGPTFGLRSKIELKNKSFEAGRVLHENGVEFAIMSDHPVLPIEYNTTQGAIFVKNGLSAEDTLKAMTIKAAEITGIADRVGSIEVGKDADIVIWSSNDPFHYMTKADTVVINGKVVL